MPERAENNFIGLASYSIVLQLLSRIVTFTITSILIRKVSAIVIGLAHVKMETMLITVLFLAREGTRTASLRWKVNPENSRQISQFSSLSKLPLLIGLVFGVGYTVLNIYTPPHELVSNYALACITYLFAILIYLTCEPFYNLIMSLGLFRQRLWLDLSALCIKSIITLVLIFSNQFSEIMCFALAEILASSILLIGYVFLTKKSVPGLSVSSVLLPDCYGNLVSKHFEFAKVSTYQNVLKLILNQGDSIIVSYCCSLFDQGIYSIASNYGTLVLRILVSPVTESLKIEINRDIEQIHVADSAIVEDQIKLLKKSVILVRTVIKALFYLILFTVLGSQYTGLAFRLLIGRKYLETDAPQLFALIFMLIGFQSINGVLDVTAQALSSGRKIRDIQFRSMCICAIFVPLVFFFISRCGVFASVYANYVIIMVRIANNLSLVWEFLKLLEVSYCQDASASKIWKVRIQESLEARHLVPDAKCILMFVVTLLISNRYVESLPLKFQFLMAICVVAVNMSMILITEPALFRRIKAKLM